MAYKSSDISVLAYANNFTLWHYKTIDNLETITRAGYFNSATDMMRVGDLIVINIDVEGEPSTKLYVVTGNTGGVVAITVYS